MKKILKNYISAWILVLIIFNVAVFASPAEMGEFNKFGGAFWSGYIFIMVSFVGQLICAFIGLKEETKEKLFLHLPIITISYSTLILALVVGTICMVVPDLPNWVGVLLCIFILGFRILAVIKATTAAGIISDIDEKVKKKTEFIKTLTPELEMLQGKAKTEEERKKLKSLYETVRYSDPVSNEKAEMIENQIKEEVKSLSKAVTEEKNITEGIEKICELMEKRNKICKLSK